MKNWLLISLGILSLEAWATKDVGNGTTGVVCFKTKEAAQALRIFDESEQLIGFRPIPDDYFEKELVQSVRVLDVLEMEEKVGGIDEIFENPAEDIIQIGESETNSAYIMRLLSRFDFLLPKVKEKMLESLKALGTYTISVGGFPGVFDIKNFNYYGENCNFNTIALQYKINRQAFWKVDQRLVNYLPQLDVVAMWLHELVVYQTLNNGASTTDSARKVVSILMTKSLGDFPNPTREIKELYEDLVNFKFLPEGGLYYENDYISTKSKELLILVAESIQVALGRKVVSLDQEVQQRLPRWAHVWRRFGCDTTEIVQNNFLLRNDKAEFLGWKYFDSTLSKKKSFSDCLALLEKPHNTRKVIGDKIAREIFDKYKNFEEETLTELKRDLLPMLIEQKVSTILQQVPMADADEKESFRLSYMRHIQESFLGNLGRTLWSNLEQAYYWFYAESSTSTKSPVKLFVDHRRVLGYVLNGDLSRSNAYVSTFTFLRTTTFSPDIPYRVRVP